MTLRPQDAMFELVLPAAVPSGPCRAFAWVPQEVVGGLGPRLPAYDLAVALDRPFVAHLSPEDAWAERHRNGDAFPGQLWVLVEVVSSDRGADVQVFGDVRVLLDHPRYWADVVLVDARWEAAGDARSPSSDTPPVHPL